MIITDAPPVNFSADGDDDHKSSLPKSLLLSAARMQFVHPWRSYLQDRPCHPIFI